VQTLEDPLERCELWVKIGRWYGEHLNRPDQGISALQQALQLNPESVSALRELAAFYRRSGDAVRLAETLARVVPLEQDPAEQAAALLDLANVQETALADAPSAIESHRRVLELDAESTPALDALARLHEGLGQWPDLVSVLGRRAASADDPDLRLNLKKRIGWVQESSLGDAAAAIETYKDILAGEPTDPDALAALERLYLTGNRVDEYLEILEAELDATADPAVQTAIYDKMAHALLTLANDPERAAGVLEKIIMLDPQRDATYVQLEEIYGRLQKWTELVETYRSHVDAAEVPARKIELLAAMADAFEKHVQDLDRAIDGHREILGIDPHNFDAANNLSRLQEAIEDWPAAVDTMGRLVELTVDPDARLQLLTRLGRVHHQKLMDTEAAEMRLSQALELDPGHVPALKLLAEIHKSRADWLKAARTLETAATSSHNQLEKTQLSSEAAFIYRDELESTEKAVEMLQRTLDLDPEHVRAGQALAEIYAAGGSVADADPIYDMLTRKAEQLGLDDEGQRDLFLAAARAARSLGNTDKALKQFKRAYDIDATNHEVLAGMADLLFEKEDWERSFKLYQTILVQHRDSQSDEETVRVYFRLGTIKSRQGEPRKALNYFEKALEVDPHHVETLDAMITLHTQSNDWEGVIAAKRALIETVPDGNLQFTIHRDIAELYAQKLGNKDKAATALENALEIQPDDLPTLHQLLDLSTSGKRWEKAISVIDRIIEIEKDQLRRSRYHYTAAVLLRDEMHAHDEAIERFNAALDDDPRMLKAFQAIDTMVTKTKDWKTLERAYRKMLKRLPGEGDDALKTTLWSNLGEIYRTRLHDFKSAAAAFDVAAKLDPGNIERHMMLAELYETLMKDSPEEFVDAAVREHQVLIANEPFRDASYHALYNIYRAANQTDKAFCLAQVLTFLKKATDEQKAFFQKYQRNDFVQARQRLSEEALRRHLFHPDEDLYLTGILGLVAPALAAWRAVELPSSLKPKDKVDIGNDPALFSRLAKYVKDVLNLPQPDVYLRPTDPGDVTLMNIKRDGSVYPSMVVFQNLLRGKTEKHLAFALGRFMMDLYMPHYAYVALDRSPQNLKQVVMACLRAAGIPVQGDTAALDQIAREILGRMHAGQSDQLKSLIRKFVESGGSTDVKRWAAAAELTGYRVGLLLCGDVQIAALMISQEQAVLGSTMAPKDKIKELVLYGISEDYFAARRAVGVAVG
jgi:tetratricopeptide (TPR) repeat protein